MNLYGCYYQEQEQTYELIFIGSKNDFLSFDKFLIYEAFAMERKTCDYDREAFIVVITKDSTLQFSKNVVPDKNFLYTQLLKINRNIKIEINGKEVKIKVK